MLLTAVAMAALITQQPTFDARRSTLTGGIQKLAAFPSKHLGNKRNVWVYMPPGYDEGERTRFPVLYCHDGQNVFDGSTSFIAGKEWRIDEAANALILAQLIEPIIIVGIENAGAERMNEYLPTRFKWNGNEMGGRADLYGKFILEELKPRIDQEFRTLTSAKDTAMLGSSLGGVVTYYLGLRFPDKFSKVAVVSPSVWANDQEMIRITKALKSKPKLKIWVDMGSEEGKNSMQEAHSFVDALLAKGWIPGKDLAFYQDGYAGHNEEAWARRVPAILMWLFRKG